MKPKIIARVYPERSGRTLPCKADCEASLWEGLRGTSITGEGKTII